MLSTSAQSNELTEAEAQKIAYDAWIYGLPLVEHFKIFSLYRSKFSPVYREWNEFFHVRNLMRADTRAVVSPNSDTLMSNVLIDVRTHPVVIEIPSSKGRYFSLQLIDILTNSFAYAGTRTTGEEAVTLVLLPPNYDQALPKALAHAQIIASPSSLVLGLGRTGAVGRADTLLAREFQNDLQITALPKYLNNTATQECAEIDWPVYYDVKHQTSLEFFHCMNFMLQWHQIQNPESAEFERFARIGIQAGQKFVPDHFPANIQRALQRGAAQARAYIESLAAEPGPQINGWCIPDAQLGDYGHNYELRAVTAWSFLYANVLDEAMYLRAYVDHNNRPLDANRDRYELRFKKNQIPAAKFFWSITMYDGEDYFLVKNSLNQYAIGDRSKLQYEEDGSLVLYLQKESPGPALESNWLPAPSGKFYLALRVYGNSALPQSLPPVIRL